MTLLIKRVPSFLGEVFRFVQDDRQLSRVVIRHATHKNPSVFIVIPSGVEESLDVSLRDVSTSLDMTKLRNVALVLFCAIARSVLAQTSQPAPTPSIVYTVHEPASIKDYKTNPRVVHEMVN